MRIRERRPRFKKINDTEIKWTCGRACIKLPGRIVVTPTNFVDISYLNLEDYSYNYFYRHSDVGSVPKIIEEEYFQYRYLRNLDSDKFREFSDLEWRHLKEARSCLTKEYDLHVLKKLDVGWDPEKLRRYLDHYKKSHKFDFQRSSLVYTTFSAMLSKHCTDSTLIVNFFQTICSHLIACESIFMGSTVYLKLFLENAHKIGFDPWTLLRTFQCQEESLLMEFCPVEWSLIQGKLDHLKLLLKYGCPFYVSNYSAKMFNKNIDGRWWNRNRAIPIVMPGNSTSPVKTPTYTTISFRYSATFMAHFTVVLYLAASNAVVFGSTDESRFKQSISIFMRCVPEPYVSHDDMLHIVGQLAPSIGGIVSMSCRWFRAAFPEESNLGRKPRTLMHLSRCTVRQSCLLPDGVAKLPLPDYLKSYLNLEW